jgi:hypothetical protein
LGAHRDQAVSLDLLEGCHDVDGRPARVGHLCSKHKTHVCMSGHACMKADGVSSLRLVRTGCDRPLQHAGRDCKHDAGAVRPPASCHHVTVTPWARNHGRTIRCSQM